METKHFVYLDSIQGHC